jgi:hypothetical protein
MLRIISVLLALASLTGMSREEVLRRMEGNWQAISDDDNWTTASAFAFDADSGSFNGDLAGRHYEGEVNTLLMIGKKVVLTFDDHFTVLVDVRRADTGTLTLSINANPKLIYRKAESPRAP